MVPYLPVACHLLYEDNEAAVSLVRISALARLSEARRDTTAYYKILPGKELTEFSSAGCRIYEVNYDHSQPCSSYPLSHISRMYEAIHTRQRTGYIHPCGIHSYPYPNLTI